MNLFCNFLIFISIMIEIASTEFLVTTSLFKYIDSCYENFILDLNNGGEAVEAF